MIIFHDAKSGRGGGQVVLEDLLARLVTRHAVGLVMPLAGRTAIAVPDGVVHWLSAAALVDGPPPGPLVLVANANASLPHVWWAARELRRKGMTVRTAAIVHNYPSDPVKGAATVGLLRRMDVAIVVEPGLCSLRADSLVPAWLAVPPRSRVADHPTGIGATGRVKSYGRPDPSKGLHLLADIFAALSADGVQCEVALGQPLDGQVRYERQLRTALHPWLVDGRRTADWVDPGDIFVVPSVSGEAACLSAQEAMSGGAVVVASRLGLMPYLSPSSTGVRTFPVGDAARATAEIRQVLAASADEFSRACLDNIAAVTARGDRWQAQTVQTLEALAG